MEGLGGQSLGIGRAQHLGHNFQGSVLGNEPGLGCSNMNSPRGTFPPSCG
jgi:hypothetical protein